MSRADDSGHSIFVSLRRNQVRTDVELAAIVAQHSRHLNNVCSCSCLLRERCTNGFLIFPD